MAPMDETTRIIPLELNGRSFKASHLTSGQQLILAGITTTNVSSSELADIIDIFHACVGDDEWREIKRGMIRGEISSHDVLEVFGKITNAPKPTPVTLTVAAPVTDQIAEAEAHLRTLMAKRGELDA